MRRGWTADVHPFLRALLSWSLLVGARVHQVPVIPGGVDRRARVALEPVGRQGSAMILSVLPKLACDARRADGALAGCYAQRSRPCYVWGGHASSRDSLVASPLPRRADAHTRRGYGMAYIASAVVYSGEVAEVR